MMIVSKSIFTDLLLYVSFTALIYIKIYFKGADPDNCDGYDDETTRWTVKRGKSKTIPCPPGLIGNYIDYLSLHSRNRNQISLKSIN